MEIVAERRVSQISAQLGKARTPVVGVLDSGAANCWISSSALWRLRAVGERVSCIPLDEGEVAGLLPPPDGIVEISTRILVYDDVWIEAGPVPFLVVREKDDFVLIAESVLERLERLPNPRRDA
eukprot:GHVU01058553.1.p5 GENE.GHVU01058553.1~~GHVU01058553.1.p5  ORF type:complete len:124 (+),score=9.88 GHVU01058553.1:1099-1470(+)